MRFIGADDIHRLLDYPSLVAALRAMFRDGAEVPARHHHRVSPTATLLLMPAWQPGRALGVKVVTVFPDNLERALPSVHGSYLLLDPATGIPRAVLDGTALTLRRTAAASALAADFLARRDSAVHLVVGTGALAPHLAAAHAALRPIRETRIWGPMRQRRRRWRPVCRPTGSPPHRPPISPPPPPQPTSSPARPWRTSR